MSYDEVAQTEYAQFLEEVIKTILTVKPDSIGVVATSADGTLTAYYNADATDKAVFAHNINMDATIDTICANIGIIKDALEEEEE